MTEYKSSPTAHGHGAGTSLLVQRDSDDGCAVLAVTGPRGGVRGFVRLAPDAVNHLAGRLEMLADARDHRCVNGFCDPVCVFDRDYLSRRAGGR